MVIRHGGSDPHPSQLSPTCLDRPGSNEGLEQTPLRECGPRGAGPHNPELTHASLMFVCLFVFLTAKEFLHPAPAPLKHAGSGQPPSLAVLSSAPPAPAPPLTPEDSPAEWPPEGPGGREDMWARPPERAVKCQTPDARRPPQCWPQAAPPPWKVGAHHRAWRPCFSSAPALSPWDSLTQAPRVLMPSHFPGHNL